MENYFSKVKDFLLEMEVLIQTENTDEQFFIVSDPERGINQMVVDCEHPILILEQAIAKIPEHSPNKEEIWKGFMQINRELVHGAFALDGNGSLVIFRDTLRLDDLDFGELEASIGALSLGLAEHGAQILEWSKAS